MNGIDYLIGKIKRMICFVLGHRLEASFKYVDPVRRHPGFKVKHYTCVRCGKKGFSQ